MPLTLIQYLASFGLILSIYFLYVKNQNSKSKKYKALCDITEKISCSKAAKSKYSNLVVLPNALYGIIFYTLVLVFPTNIVLYLAIFASLISLYLIYTSIKIKVFCLVCTLTYIINFLILFFSYSA
jgi:vitamin-K-epoxide reductase (warfarin-sensitive)